MQSNKSHQQLHCIIFLPTGLHKSLCFDISPILSYTTNAQLKETRKDELSYVEHLFAKILTSNKNGLKLYLHITITVYSPNARDSSTNAIILADSIPNLQIL